MWKRCFVCNVAVIKSKPCVSEIEVDDGNIMNKHDSDSVITDFTGEEDNGENGNCAQSGATEEGDILMPM